MSFLSLNEWMNLTKIKDNMILILQIYLDKIRIKLPDDLNLFQILFKNSKDDDKITKWQDLEFVNKYISKKVIKPNIKYYYYYSNLPLSNQNIIINHNLNNDNIIIHTYQKLDKNNYWININSDIIIIDDNNIEVLNHIGYLKMLILYY